MYVYLKGFSRIKASSRVVTYLIKLNLVYSVGEPFIVQPILLLILITINFYFENEFGYLVRPNLVEN
jgi:hypothetical protein